jgi:RHS repeat-associated protein
MAGFESGAGRYRRTVSRSISSSRAILRDDHPLAASVAIECCRFIESWFVTHQCGYRRPLRNPTLKVAGFDRPLTSELTARLYLRCFLEELRQRHGCGTVRGINWRPQRGSRLIWLKPCLGKLQLKMCKEFGSNITRHDGIFTVAGATRGGATGVTVNSSAATLYGDHTFASTNHTLADGNNTFTAVAADGYGRTSTDAVTAYLPATNSFVYDANGNLTSDGQRNFAYDDENQLISVWVTNAWRSDFVYDGKLRRRARFESKWVGGTWVTNTLVRYVYDGNLVVQERDGNNLPSVTYTRGKDLSGSLEGAGGIGGLLARTDNSGALGVPSATYPHAYYHADANGNVTCLVDSGQAVVAKYLYDPFGNILSQSGVLADANLYQFSTKEFHSPSGLISYLYRYYDPLLQRWLNRDPMDELGFIPKAKARWRAILQRDSPDPVDVVVSTMLQGRMLQGDGANTFLAMHNNLINSFDSFGLTACTDMCDSDFDQKFHNCTGYANTAAKCGAVGGGIFGGIFGAGVGGAPGCVCGAVVFGGLDAGGFYVLTKAACRYAAIIARGACYAGCMSVEGL